MLVVLQCRMCFLNKWNLWFFTDTYHLIIDPLRKFGSHSISAVDILLRIKAVESYFYSPTKEGIVLKLMIVSVCNHNI